MCGQDNTIAVTATTEAYELLHGFHKLLAAMSTTIRTFTQCWVLSGVPATHFYVRFILNGGVCCFQNTGTQRGGVSWQMGVERTGMCVGRVLTPPLLCWVAGVDVAVPHSHSSCPFIHTTNQTCRWILWLCQVLV